MSYILVNCHLARTRRVLLCFIYLCGTPEEVRGCIQKSPD